MTPDVTPWDAAAPGWDANTVLIRAWLHQPTQAMLAAAQLTPGMRVLDVAAGSGDQTLDIADRVFPGGEVLATDLSPRMVALANARLRDTGRHWARAEVADAEVPLPEPGSFDAALCRLGLMFCASPLRALGAMWQALRPGGRVAALVFSQPEANPCLTILMGTARRHAGLPVAGPPPPASLLSLGQPGLLARLAGEAGLEHVAVQPLAAPFRLPAAADYLAFVRSAGSPILEILRPLPDAAQQRAWQDIEEQLQQFTTADGWVGPNELLLLAASRH